MNWTLDTAHSEVTFSVRHMMVSTVRGRFGAFGADVDFDPDAIEPSRVNATIEVSSLTTGNGDRDAHLRSADFFDAESHPHITFASRTIERRGRDGIRVVGDLTIRGVTREVELRGEIHGPVPSPMGGAAVGVSLEGQIDREDFGLKWNVAMETGGVLVGKSVKIGIEAELAGAAASVDSAAEAAA